MRAQLASLVSAVPSDVSNRIELAMFDLRTGDQVLAEKELADLHRSHPDNARVDYLLGLLYLQRGQETDAVGPLERAAAALPDDSMAQQSAALACYGAGRTEEAKRYARAALKADTRFAEGWLLLARLDDAHGTALQALRYADEYLKYSPHPAEGFYLKGRIYFRLASRDEAETWLRKAVDAEPSNPEYWVALGRVYCELSGAMKAQEGIACYEKALAADPKSASAHRYLGQTLLQQRRYDEAAAHLRAALPGLDDPGPAMYDLAQALMKGGHAEEGREALQEYRQQQEFAAGVKRMSDAIAANPVDRSRRYALIRFCLDHGRKAAALAAIREAVSRCGDDATLHALQSEASGAAAPGSLLPLNGTTGHAS